MEELVVILITLGIIVFSAGPMAVIMAIVLFNKLGNVERRLNRIESKDFESPVPKQAPPPVVPLKEPFTSPPPPKPVEVPIPPESQPAPHFEPPVQRPAESSEISEQPVMPTVEIPEITPAIPTTPKTGLELKIGTTVASIVGAIILIIGVSFFVKHVIEEKLFSDVARVCLVAAGGFVALVIGEVFRRRDYGIVAKSSAALGFVLLYIAVIGASWVYHLISLQLALILALGITAATMTYAVCLNERLIAFLSLLGGYLSPAIIMYEQDLPMPVFSYILALSVGAMACAMFRRWRAINGLSFVGTFVLYTMWFGQFYRPIVLLVALSWLAVFGVLYMVLPILYGLTRKVVSRVEDVILIVFNSIVVFFFLWQILYADYQTQLSFAAAGMGIAPLLLMGAVFFRCRDDVKLQSSLGVLGTAFVTLAFPLYFSEVQPTVLCWALEAVALTFVAIRYKSIWPKVMAFLTTAIATAGLFYHLPLHVFDREGYRFIFNAPFGTWLFVAAAIFVCHGLWRFMKSDQGKESAAAAQLFYVWGALLLAVGCFLEWLTYCDWVVAGSQEDSFILMGAMVIATALVFVLLTRPLCPKGKGIKFVGATAAIAGAIFTALATMGVYEAPFRLFINAPFTIACLFAASLFWGTWQIHKTADENKSQTELVGALIMAGLILLFVLVTEQIYMYWYCRNEAHRIANWETMVWQYMTIAWAVYGLAMLFAGIRFKKSPIRVLGVVAAALSAVALLNNLPLHRMGDFRFVFNLPFMTWVCASAAILLGHSLWRFMPQASQWEKKYASQLYYTVGLLLLAAGCLLEWYAHCRWQVSDVDVGYTNFMLGTMILCAVSVVSFFTRPLPPAGWIVRTVGLGLGLAGAVYTLFVTDQAYHAVFSIFANVPFLIMLLYIAMMLLVAVFVKTETEGHFKLSPLIVLAALVLLWILLSQQIYQFWLCRNKYAVDKIANWQFLAQMYMSVSWAVYAAVLLLIGFFRRAAGIRYLSLAIFAVLLIKINLFDMTTLETEYRIVTFVTTGLIFVGVSFLYQFLRKKGFFDPAPAESVKEISSENE